MTFTHVFPQVVVPFILYLVSYSVCSFDDHNRRNSSCRTSIGRAFSGFSATTNSERRYEGDRNALWLSSHLPGDCDGANLEPGFSFLPSCMAYVMVYRATSLLLRLLF
jgi:hypothetical protein